MEDSLELDQVAVQSEAVEFQRSRARAFSQLFDEPLEEVKVGRFSVLEPLGSGGMGTVYAAFDPQLDRKVALKFLRTDTGGDPERLRAEARTMARLQHPNVVAVFEVGDYRGQVFLAMEFVDGVTLREFVRTRRDDWRRTLRAYLEAGKGIAAAHTAGIVHRDFKPDNVLVDREGRPRVTDFGLAHTGDDDPTPGGGTPAYMPPEQKSGGVVDGRSDQYAFCVALWEGLHGKRPPDGGAAIPAAIMRALERGLAEDPGDRFPQMPALLDALARPLRRRRQGAAVSVALVLVGGVAGSAFALAGGDESPCEPSEDPLAGAWDNARRTRIDRSFADSGVAYAAETRRRVDNDVEAYVHAWTAARRDACLATLERGEQSPELMDLRMACLDRRRAAVDALGEVLETADRDVVERAVSLATSLPRIDACSDRERLQSREPIPDDAPTREAVEAIEADVQRAVATRQAGKYEDARALASRVVEQAESVGFGPTIAVAHLELGRAHAALADADPAQDHLRRAARVAGEAGVPVVAAQASIAWLGVVGELEARRDEARGLEHAAEVAMALAGQPPRPHAELLAVRSRVAFLASDYDQAVALGQDAVARADDAFGPNHPRTAEALAALAAARQAAGKLAEAEEANERALEIRTSRFGSIHPAVAESLTVLGGNQLAQGRFADAEKNLRRAVSVGTEALGPEHPSLARALVNLGNALLERGAYEDAREHFERGIALLEAKLGAEHLHVAATLINLGAAEYELGRLAEARAAYERSLAIFEKTIGKDHVHVAVALSNLAGILRDEGDLDAAAQHLQRSIAIRKAKLGEDHPQLARAWVDLAAVDRERGRLAEASQMLERALAVQTKALGESHPMVGQTVRELGLLSLTRGNTAEALATLQRASNIAKLSKDGPVEQARTKFALARAQSTAGDHDTAVATAKDARTLGAKSPSLGREIDAWLAVAGAGL